jgi:autophagy-related protein 5
VSPHYSAVRVFNTYRNIVGQPQTLGTALNSILPTLFPSRRSPLLAHAVLHGAVVPLSANFEDLVRAATYADGWLHLVVVMMG